MPLTRRLCALALLVTAAVFFGQGTWIYAKAVLAQILLRSAWAGTLHGAVAVRPWPWADTWPVARLFVPHLGVDLIVLAGASGRTMAFGPGHMAGTPLPGSLGNSVITGHRDTHFRFLAELENGDAIHLDDAHGRRHRFIVSARHVVHQSDVAVLDGALDGTTKPTLTLITCFPFHSVATGGPLRYVVHAVRASAGTGFRQRPPPNRAEKRLVPTSRGKPPACHSVLSSPRGAVVDSRRTRYADLWRPIRAWPWDRFPC